MTEESQDLHKPRIEVTTKKIVSNQTGTRQDRRQISVKVSKVADQKLTVIVVWLGDGGDPSKYGRYKTAKKDIEQGGTLEFNVAYNSKKKFGRNYRGYAVRLKGIDGNSLAETASQTPFVRFLPGSN